MSFIFFPVEKLKLFPKRKLPAILQNKPSVAMYPRKKNEGALDKYTVKIKYKKVYYDNLNPKLKKENVLYFNIKIDFCLTNKKKQLQKNAPYLYKNLYEKSFVSNVFRKTIHNTFFGYHKQYLYRLIDFVLAFYTLKNELFSTEIFSLPQMFTISKFRNKHFLKDYVGKAIFGLHTLTSRKKQYSNLVWGQLYENFNGLNFKQAYIYMLVFLTKKISIKIKYNVSYNPEMFLIEKHYQKYVTNKIVAGQITLRQWYRYKHILDFLQGRVTNKMFNNSTFNAFVGQRLLNTPKTKLNLIAKQGSLGIQTLIRYGIKQKKSRRIKRFGFKQELSSSLLFFLAKLDEKKDLLLQENKNVDNLIGLRNFFLEKGLAKFNNNKTFGLSTVLYFSWIYELQNYDDIYENALAETLEEEKNLPLEFAPAYNVSKLTQLSLKPKNLKVLKSISRFKGTKRWDYLALNRRVWKQKKFVATQTNTSIKNIHHYFSIFFGKNVSIIFINALALTKFAYTFPIRKKSPQRFLNFIEREMIQRYKYIAVYIQDFIRVCYLSFFLKKPTFIASFMGFQLAKLPRNRKETQFIRFLIKVIKIFGAQRPEITAIKVEFKGRVNRWRRTKVIRGTRGVMSYFQFNNRIEFGSGKAITRKGTLGIRLWLCYKGTFTLTFQEILLGYMDYSQLHKAKTINRFLLNFKSKKLKYFVTKKNHD